MPRGESEPGHFEETSRWWADLAAIVLLSLLMLVVVLVPGLNETSLRVVFGLIFVLFLPGYAFIAALFPDSGTSPVSDSELPEGRESPTEGEEDTERPSSSEETGSSSEKTWLFERRTDRSGIDGLERVALSFALSIAIVPLVAFIMDIWGWGIGLVPMIPAITLFTLGCIAIAAARRWKLEPEDRFVVPYRAWIGVAKAEVSDLRNGGDAVVNVALALAIVLAIASIGYAVALPPQGEEYTDFHLLTENEEGELVADGYPEEIVLGESAELVVGVSNNERSTEEYTVVVKLEEIDVDDDTTSVQRWETLDQFSITLDHGESDQRIHALEPTMVGEDLRVVYLLYKGDVPTEPTRENSYRDLHIWIDVVESDG